MKMKNLEDFQLSTEEQVTVKGGAGSELADSVQ
jgi:hypothetical protein